MKNSERSTKTEPNSEPEYAFSPVRPGRIRERVTNLSYVILRFAVRLTLVLGVVRLAVGLWQLLQADKLEAIPFALGFGTVLLQSFFIFAAAEALRLLLHVHAMLTQLSRAALAQLKRADRG